MAKSTSPKPAKLPRKTVTDATDKHTLKCLGGQATDVYEASIKDGKPELSSPVRSLGNVKFDPKVGWLEIGKQKKVRTLTVNTVKSFAQTLRMMALSKEMIESDTFATKREAYYVSKLSLIHI